MKQIICDKAIVPYLKDAECLVLEKGGIVYVYTEQTERAQAVVNRVMPGYMLEFKDVEEFAKTMDEMSVPELESMIIMLSNKEYDHEWQNEFTRQEIKEMRQMIAKKKAS